MLLRGGAVLGKLRHMSTVAQSEQVGGDAQQNPYTLSVAQAAAMCRRSKKQVRLWARTGRIDAKRPYPGAHWMVHWSFMARFTAISSETHDEAVQRRRDARATENRQRQKRLAERSAS